MSRKLNEKFLNVFIEIDKHCCEKFGVASGGVTEYINRLNNARFAHGRDEALPRLVRYRNTRNRFAHEPSALRKSDEISKDDLKWITKFKKELFARRDPISRYLRKARRYARRRRLFKYAISFLVLLLVVAVAVLCIALAH